MYDNIRVKEKNKSAAGKSRLIPPIVICVLTLVIITLTVLSQDSRMEFFLTEHYLEMLAMLPCAVLLILLGLIVGMDPYIRKDLRRTMMMIILVAAVLIVQNYLEYELTLGEPRWLARTLTAILGYALRPVALALFLHIVAPGRKDTWVWALLGLNAVIYMTALISPVCFWINENNQYNGGPLANSCLYVSALLLAYLLYETLHIFRPGQKGENWVPVLVLGTIICAILLDYNVGRLAQPVSYLTIVTVIGCVAYYIWLHIQFVREHEQELKAGQQIQLMLSQIRPHFLYNSLGTIEELCDSDPKTAKRATIQFAQYLRGNMDSIGQEGNISFEKELEHTRLYLALEKLRFEDALQVEYEIESDDFSIPPLTLEPMVENAVRHGIRGNADGRGTIVISTRETAEAYEISVRDNGPGFDPEAAQKKEGSHVGIRNVRNRVESMRGGAVVIHSVPGQGTEVTIILPKNAVSE